MRYEQYSPSIIRWNHEYPTHWSCEKAKRFFANPKKLNKENEESNILSLTLRGVIRNNGEKPIGLSPSDYSTYQIFDSGELVFKLIDLNNISTSRVGLVPEKGIMSSAYIRFVPRADMNVKYFYYQYYDWYKRNIFNGLGEGVRQTLSGNDLRNLEILVPPRKEQDQIVRYLDWQVSKINKLIAAKKKQIRLLKELRKAITDEGILHGFTSSEIKDSGVLWLGGIPAHWSVKPLKRVCRVNASISHLTAALNDDTSVTFLPMENVSVIGEVDCTIKKPLSEVRSGFSSFAKGDVVVAKITPCFENGKGACLDSLDTEIGFGTTEFINLRPYHDINSKYLYLITMTRPFRVLGEKVMTGSAGQKRVSPEHIKNFTIGIPPLDEQNSILEEIDRRVSRIDEQICCENESISVLFELRTRLISDVVTGQIDVRVKEVPDFDVIEEIDTDEEILDDEYSADETEEQEE